MSVGPLQLLLIVVLVILLFGTKKLGNIGSDLGKAIRGFKKGMQDGDDDESKQGDRAESLKADPPNPDGAAKDNVDSSKQRPER